MSQRSHMTRSKRKKLDRKIPITTPKKRIKLASRQDRKNSIPEQKTNSVDNNNSNNVKNDASKLNNDVVEDEKLIIIIIVILVVMIMIEEMVKKIILPQVRVIVI